jgi:hypothetical protein
MASLTLYFGLRERKIGTMISFHVQIHIFVKLKFIAILNTLILRLYGYFYDHRKFVVKLKIIVAHVEAEKMTLLYVNGIYK